jgi:hypothetical protein
MRDSTCDPHHALCPTRLRLIVQKRVHAITPGRKHTQVNMAALFQFIGGGIGVMPDPADNSGGHIVPNHDAGTRISYEVANVGDADGNAIVGIELDAVFQANSQSSVLTPGERETGFAPLGRLSEGSHTVLVFVNPGSGQSDHETNTFEVA